MKNYIEQPRNASEKVLVCILLDRSGSMSGCIEELNAGVESFLETIRNDATLSSVLDISLIAFDDTVEVLNEPNLAQDIEFKNLEAGGCTAMVDAIGTSIKLIESRRNYYQEQNIPYKTPWVVLLSDGAETEKTDKLDELSQSIDDLTKQGRFIIQPVAIESEAVADLEKLVGFKREKGDGKRSFIRQKVYLLKGTSFTDFFEIVSDQAAYIVAHNDEEGYSI